VSISRSGASQIIKGKPGRDRVVPLHESAVRALSKYAERRDREFPRGPKSDAFFLSQRATAIQYQRVTSTFRQLRRQLGWHDAPLPRIHDLRHTFAVRTLVRWCEAGDDVDKKILALTTYLGHMHVTSTYWYFSAVPPEKGKSIRVLGKGRKLRFDPVFPNRRGLRMTRSGIEKRLHRVVRRAAATCPSLNGRKISPHTLRHTTAMHLLQAGVDVNSIALWLGHVNPSTTHAYVEADLAMKERTLYKLAPTSARSRRFRADDRLLAFLNDL
jgi:site-specific recombinase XerD